MNLEYVSVQEKSLEWGVSIRQVQALCKQGKIEGVVQFGRNWMIPKDAKKPSDHRTKKGKIENLQKLPIACPLLTMTSIYDTPGKAYRASRGLKSNPVARSLFDAEIAYWKGCLSEVKSYVNTFNPENKGINALLGTYILKSLCAFWEGNIEVWKESRKQISLVVRENEADEKLVSLALVVLDILAYNNSSFPSWFERGSFEELPKEVHGFAKVFYARLLFMVAVGVASKQYEVEGINGLALMKVIHNTVEPMIAQAIVDQQVIPEICLRLTCATVYHNSGLKDLAIYHTDKAIGLAVKDELYMILVEYWRQLDLLLEERLNLIDEQITKKVKELFKELAIGANKTRSYVKNRKLAVNLTNREREIAKFVSFGFTNKQIAQRLKVSDETIKSTIQNIMQKTGTTDRSEFVLFI